MVSIETLIGIQKHFLSDCAYKTLYRTPCLVNIVTFTITPKKISCNIF